MLQRSRATLCTFGRWARWVLWKVKRHNMICMYHNLPFSVPLINCSTSSAAYPSWIYKGLSDWTRSCKSIWVPWERHAAFETNNHRLTLQNSKNFFFACSSGVEPCTPIISPPRLYKTKLITLFPWSDWNQMDSLPDTFKIWWCRYQFIEPQTSVNVAPSFLHRNWSLFAKWGDRMERKGGSRYRTLRGRARIGQVLPVHMQVPASLSSSSKDCDRPLSSIAYRLRKITINDSSKFAQRRRKKPGLRHFATSVMNHLKSFT